ncbi:MAG: ubiquinol-cytochrome C chaperone [Alphaproteobacteria bacterium]|nr:ubiquinol-cytochrome C chaperone [Alphaproteobacteria bacterium]|tara:strand:- start:4107 stop:4703 length:597 start_codon:yes stop_codon:yes gene_type:complete
MFGLIFSRRKRVELQKAQKMLDIVNDFSRQEVFYTQYGVPDTMTGRFDLISLVASLVVIRLNRIANKDSQGLVQAFFDVMFRQFDYSLREGGVGDLSVPKHMKRMMQGFQGRAHAYDMALVRGMDDDGHALSDEQKYDLLSRNLYNNEPSDAVTAAYGLFAELAAYIMQLSDDEILAGNIDFPKITALENKQATKSAA